MQTRKSGKRTGIGRTLRKEVACPLGRLPWGGTLDEVLRRFASDSFHWQGSINCPGKVWRPPKNVDLNCRYFTKVPHFPGDLVNLDLAKHIQKKWKEYGFDSATLKKYIIMLSRPTKPGIVALYDDSGQEIYRSAPQETFLVPSEKNSSVVPPFNAYSPPGSVKVKKIRYSISSLKNFRPFSLGKVNVVKILGLLEW